MPASTMSTHLSPAELSYLHTSLSSHPPIRPDSRTASDFRPLNAETGILPNTMGSAHVGFADGREAVVGVRAEVENTPRDSSEPISGFDRAVGSTDVDVEMVDSEGQLKGQVLRGRTEWITLGLTLPGMRDDDKDLVFLEEMLRETLIAPAISLSQDDESSAARSLPSALVINYRWHWHLYVDVLLISAPDPAALSSTSGTTTNSANFPLPLLSMAIHLALRDTKLPKLKSEGDDDPMADDDWEAAVHLYSRVQKSSTTNTNVGAKVGILQLGLVPPVTLLVMVVAENVIFDPSSTELAVADGVLAVSINRIVPSSHKVSGATDEVRILAVRTIETPARDTMKGVLRDAVEGDIQQNNPSDQIVSGIWKPKVGGIKRTVLMKVIKNVTEGGVGAEVLAGLDQFVTTV